MGPATSAVLRNVLVERLCQVALSIDITPVEGIGELVGTDVGVRESRLETVVDSIFTDLDFAEVLGGGDREDGGESESRGQFHCGSVDLDIFCLKNDILICCFIPTKKL